MRILVITASYAPVWGGLQTAVGALASEWQKGGHIVHVVTQRYPRQLPRFEEINGVPVWRRIFLAPQPKYIRQGRADLFLAGFFYWPVTQYWLYRAVQEFQPDVINLHFPDSQVRFLSSLMRTAQYRLVISLHGHDILRWFDESKKQCEDNQRQNELQNLFQQASAVTACSKYLLEKATQVFPAIQQKGCVVHNGVETTRFEGKKAFLHTRHYCLAYGRLTKVKGFDLLITAFARIARLVPDMDLIIAGDGEERSSLEKIVDQYSLPNRVLFWGHATSAQVVELLHGCEFVVIPSRAETFGIVALESMAAGKPIVAVRVGGLPEILESSTNCLVAPTIDGLVSGMMELSQSQNLSSIGVQNQMLARKFTWQIAAEQYLQIFNTLPIHDA